MPTIVAGTGGLKSLPADQRSSIIASVRAGEYNLFVGAGISLDATNAYGPLPSGSDFKNSLCSLLGASAGSSLQRVYSGLTSTQVASHVTSRFARCKAGTTSLQIPRFVWRRIFTLNIDDVLESAYNHPGAIQKFKPYHFKDTFEELRTLEAVQIVHLHGWAEQPDKGYVFARSEYARIMADSNAWMTVLADILPVEPFIIGGTSLDEIDLEFYLARRTANSAREDRGTSFFVEPYPDSQTAKDCDRHGLHFYHGTMGEFLAELDELAPARLAPFDLVTGDTRNLFPDGAPKSVVLSFSADFDRVPAGVRADGNGIKFSYGNPPEWSDLAAGHDVGRALAARVRPMAEAMLAGRLTEQVIVILDETGVGKSTALRRIAFDLATAGYAVLDCSSLSRLDAQATSEAIDLIDEPLVIIIDNFAEQSSAISNILSSIYKADVVLICAERNYRERHILRSLGVHPHRVVDGLRLNRAEASQLVESYVKRGMTASQEAVRQPARFAAGLVNEPIAVACCHILNDMRPLDRIVQSTYETAHPAERDRYLVAALAQYCYSGGVRYDILAAISGQSYWNEQFRSAHPLPLDYYDSSRRNFVVPLNATLALRTLERAPSEDVARAFERLALGISARVNSQSIKRRAPEARLAGRLFDYEDVISRFLKNGAGDYYSKVKPAWQWNSRYWEQVALYHLARFRTERDEVLLQQAVQHARHAVAIEPHPFPFTTLGKVLFAQMMQPGISKSAVYAEAEAALARAIQMENAMGRGSVHAQVTLFRGTVDYIRSGGDLDGDQHARVSEFISLATKYFPRDRELRELAESLRALL